ncbi:MAG: hypothetical protein VR71_07825 [Roseovarius sp. BRH_c41]|nr:MAG: hypothetical protein VR71_07825 [Roseovarius sp. BRH_c41]
MPRTKAIDTRPKGTPRVTVILSLILGLAAALGAGALSGIRIGKDALGTELAAYMGGLYGIISGSVAVVLTVLVLSLT